MGSLSPEAHLALIVSVLVAFRVTGLLLLVQLDLWPGRLRLRKEPDA